MKKNILEILAIFIVGTVGGIFADQILWPYFIEQPLFSEYRLEQRPVYVTERKEITIQENVALREAIEKVEGVIVGVRAGALNGSGLVITSDGLIVSLANLGILDSDFQCFVEGKEVSWQILKKDLKNNLALIKVNKTNLKTSGFADLEKIKLGERVFLSGVIFEKGVPKKVVNEGIIKSFDENSIETNIFEENQVSGAPLFNIEGEVLGLAIIDKAGKVSAIPVSKIKEFAGF